MSRAHKECGRRHNIGQGQKKFKPPQKRVHQSPFYLLLEHPSAGVRQRRAKLAKGTDGQARKHKRKRKSTLHILLERPRTSSRERRDKPAKSAGGDTRMHGVRKRPRQWIRLEDVPPTTLLSTGAPGGRRVPKVTQANKEHER